MRTTSGAQISYTSVNELSSAARVTKFFQGSDPASCTDAAMAYMAALEAANPGEWNACFIDLSGSGDGHVFTLVMEFGRSGQAIDVVGEDIAEARVTSYLASQEDALDNADALAQAAMVAGDVEDAEVSQMLFAGASQGTRFSGIYFGEAEPPTP